MFDIVDTAHSYAKELTVCSFLRDLSEGKGSSLQLIGNAHTAFLLCGTELSNLRVVSNCHKVLTLLQSFKQLTQILHQCKNI